MFVVMIRSFEIKLLVQFKKIKEKTCAKFGNLSPSEMYVILTFCQKSRCWHDSNLKRLKYVQLLSYYLHLSSS